MKIVQRIGVFETNSSSTHTLMLRRKDDWEKQKSTKYKKYNVLTAPQDKLYMACGCCHELFPHEEDADKEEAEQFDTIRRFIRENNELPELSPYDISCEIAVELFVGVYCEKYGGDYEALAKQINKENLSGRACHMRFFEEGALYDADSDYGIIQNLFFGETGNALASVRRKIAVYLDEAYVLCYREFWQGYGYDDDDED